MEATNEKQRRVPEEMRIDCEKVTNKITVFLLDYFGKSRRKKAIVGLSGGIDSAVVAALSKKALGVENVIVLKLTYRSPWCQESIRDADLVINSLGLLSENVFQRDINKAVDAVAEDRLDQIRLGNIMARIRMAYLYDFAQKHDGLVIGTSNKSELLLGYFTRWGDGAADLEPISDLYKTQVFPLARYLNIPEGIITKIPTADLWQGQTDEGEIGCPYDLLDSLLFLLIDKGMTKEKIIKDYGYEEADLKKIINWVNANEFKRKPIPVCKIN
jgi:NAD+ synthase